MVAGLCCGHIAHLYSLHCTTHAAKHFTTRRYYNSQVGAELYTFSGSFLFEAGSTWWEASDHRDISSYFSCTGSFFIPRNWQDGYLEQRSRHPGNSLSSSPLPPPPFTSYLDDHELLFLTQSCHTTSTFRSSCRRPALSLSPSFISRISPVFIVRCNSCYRHSPVLMCPARAAGSTYYQSSLRHMLPPLEKTKDGLASAQQVSLGSFFP